jgi:hypothetical protein
MVVASRRALWDGVCGGNGAVAACRAKIGRWDGSIGTNDSWRCGHGVLPTACCAENEFATGATVPPQVAPELFYGVYLGNTGCSFGDV